MISIFYSCDKLVFENLVADFLDDSLIYSKKYLFRINYRKLFFFSIEVLTLCYFLNRFLRHPSLHQRSPVSLQSCKLCFLATPPTTHLL